MLAHVLAKTEMLSQRLTLTVLLDLGEAQGNLRCYRKSDKTLSPTPERIMSPGRYLEGWILFRWNPRMSGVVQKSPWHMRVCIYVHVYMHAYTHIFFARELQGEVSYDHTQIWIIVLGVPLIVIAWSIAMLSFQPHLQLRLISILANWSIRWVIWHAYFTQEETEKLALSHRTEWWKTRLGVCTLWPLILYSILLPSYSEYRILRKKKPSVWSPKERSQSV